MQQRLIYYKQQKIGPAVARFVNIGGINLRWFEDGDDSKLGEDSKATIGCQQGWYSKAMFDDSSWEASVVANNNHFMVC